MLHCAVRNTAKHGMVYNLTPKALALVQMFWPDTVCSTKLHFAAGGCPNAKQSIVISFCTRYVKLLVSAFNMSA